MEAKRLMKVTYQDLKKGIRLNAYADAVIWSEDPSPTLAGLRFGGYAEVVRGLTDAIYGGATIEIEDVDGSFLTLKSLSKQYRREVSHEGLYAEATLIAEDEIQESSKSQDEKSRKHAQKDDLFDDNVPQQDIPAHICYIFCHPGNEDELFQAIDQKSYVPMIPEYQDYVLAELKRRRILRPLRVRSLYQELEAWKLCCEAKDQNLVRVMEDGLKRGKIKIPGASPGPSLLDGVHSVTDYPDGRPMGKVANTVLRLKRQETHRIFDQFWKKQGWSRSAAYRWLARSLNIPEQDAHIGLMEMDECERVIRLCLIQPKKRKAA